MMPGTIFEPRPQKQLWGCWVALGIVLVFVLFMIFIPTTHGWGGGKASAKRMQDISNLKQIGTALSIYLFDHDDRFPPDMSSPRAGFKYFGDYMKKDDNGKVWALYSYAPDSPEFLGNGSLALKLQSAIKEPSRVIGFFDSAPFSNKRRHVMFADTSVRSWEEAVFQKAVANRWREPEEAPAK